MEARLLERTSGSEAGSVFVDLFWTPVLGPTALLMWRRLIRDASDGEVDIEMIGQELGVKAPQARRTLERLKQFRIVWDENEVLVVPDRIVQRLSRRQVERLTPRLQAQYDAMRLAAARGEGS